MECTETSCEGGMRCCVNINYQPGFYCKIVSQCEQEPIWQVIVIPALLAFLALALGIMICLKLRGKKRSKRTVASYVKQQIRMKPKPIMPAIRSTNTFGSMPIIVQNLISKQIETEATPNYKRTTTDLSSPN